MTIAVRQGDPAVLIRDIEPTSANINMCAVGDELIEVAGVECKGDKALCLKTLVANKANAPIICTVLRQVGKSSASKPAAPALQAAPPPPALPAAAPLPPPQPQAPPRPAASASAPSSTYSAGSHVLVERSNGSMTPGVVKRADPSRGLYMVEIDGLGERAVPADRVRLAPSSADAAPPPPTRAVAQPPDARTPAPPAPPTPPTPATEPTSVTVGSIVLVKRSNGSESRGLVMRAEPSRGLYTVEIEGMGERAVPVDRVRLDPAGAPASASIAPPPPPKADPPAPPTPETPAPSSTSTYPVGSRVLVKRSNGSDTPGVVMKADPSRGLYKVAMEEVGERAVPADRVRLDPISAEPRDATSVKAQIALSAQLNAAQDQATVEKAAADKAAADKAAADKAAADKAAADKAAADKAAAEKVVADKAAADKVAVEKSKKVAADKAAAEKAAVERAQQEAADKVAAEKAAAEKARAKAPAPAPAINSKAAASTSSSPASSSTQLGFTVGVGKKAGLEVWRIESKEVASVPSAMHGKFHEGDSYIVLKTSQRAGSSSLVWDLFYWLGGQSEVAEQGVAAYKAVELDELLGGAPVQSREEQGYESDRFMQCFKRVEYLKGGVDSGFTHVDRDAYEPRLLHLKGTRIVRVTSVPLQPSSLNAGDVFILDMGLTLLQWNGNEANRKEKAKALEVGTGIKNDERGGKARLTQCDQGREPAEFWKALGGKGPIAPATPDAHPAEGAASGAAGLREAKLIRVSDATGALETTVVASGTLKRDMLDTKDVFIMDNGTEIFVWVGKGATADERKGGMRIGTEYCAQGDRPKGTRVLKVTEKAETTVFKSNFASWPNENALLPGATPMASRIAASGPSLSASDLVGGAMGSADELASRRSQGSSAAAHGPVGTVDVWRIEGFAPVRIDDRSRHGEFYRGDSYIVQHTSKPRRGAKEDVTLYFWLGTHSSVDEQASAAMHTTQMDDALGGAATQVRVECGREPAHFLRLFEGSMVVHSGGMASGFKNRDDADSYDTDGVSLFHVRGTDALDTRAMQVEEIASSLNSGDCFVLLTPPVMFVWLGTGANESERHTAQHVAARMQEKRRLQLVNEGTEPPPFWAALGGKGAYPNAKVLPDADREPMLFCASNATGALRFEPIFDFAQADLDHDDVFLLDTFTTIFVWIGEGANEAEKRAAPELAAAYISKRGYEQTVPVVTVKSGYEPAIFTCHFLGWDASSAKGFIDPYEAKLQAAAAAKRASQRSPPASLYEARLQASKVDTATLPARFDAHARASTEQVMDDSEERTDSDEADSDESGPSVSTARAPPLQTPSPRRPMRSTTPRSPAEASPVTTAWVSTLGFASVTADMLLDGKPDGVDEKSFLASLDEDTIATMFMEDTELPQRLAACVWRGIKELRTLQA